MRGDPIGPPLVSGAVRHGSGPKGGGCVGCSAPGTNVDVLKVPDPASNASRTLDVSGVYVGQQADLPPVGYTGSPLCDGAWGSLVLNILALLEADYNCRTLCPTGTGYLCESSWNPETCELSYACCSCNVAAPPLGPKDPPLADPGPVV